MTLSLLHQVGHNSNWNIESYEEFGHGDGLIISPMHQTMQSVERLSIETKCCSLFDPQFYLPSSRKPKLNTYPFFPEAVNGGFQTSTFSRHSAQIAEECIGFQKQQGFRSIVIPTRFLDEMYSDYVDRQRAFTVDSFIDAAGASPVCLTLSVTSAMIEDHWFRAKILNWITSYPNAEEIYLIYQHSRDSKQIQDTKFLSSCVLFFREIQDTGLKLTVGYTNVEGLLFASLADLTITMGAFENTRIFSIDKFLETEGERRGPKARIYLCGLMNWLQLEDAKTIYRNAPRIWDQIYNPTQWSEEALKLAVEPTFNQPQLYKHYFSNTADLIAEFKSMNIAHRTNFFLKKLQRAQEFYAAIEDSNILLEKHGRGGHIHSWIRTLSSI